MARSKPAKSRPRRTLTTLIIVVIVVVAIAAVSIWKTLTRPRQGITMTPELAKIMDAWVKKVPKEGFGSGGGQPRGTQQTPTRPQQSEK